MSLNIWALSIVKWLDAGYPATQVVFIRAAVGLILILPLIWLYRADFRHVEHLRLHLLRVGLSVVTLTASFFAISRVPLALFTAVNFTRPIVTMVMAAIILNEAIGPRRWWAAGLALIGVFLAANPAKCTGRSASRHWCWWSSPDRRRSLRHAGCAPPRPSS